MQFFTSQDKSSKLRRRLFYSRQGRQRCGLSGKIRERIIVQLSLDSSDPKIKRRTTRYKSDGVTTCDENSKHSNQQKMMMMLKLVLNRERIVVIVGIKSAENQEKRSNFLGMNLCRFRSSGCCSDFVQNDDEPKINPMVNGLTTTMSHVLNHNDDLNQTFSV